MPDFQTPASTKGTTYSDMSSLPQVFALLHTPHTNHNQKMNFRPITADQNKEKAKELGELERSDGLQVDHDVRRQVSLWKTT